MQKWHVRVPQKCSKKYIYGGLFMGKAAAEAKALELREQHGLQRKVPYPGVKWRQRDQKWRARYRDRQFGIRPKDHSKEELERSFKVAVAWKQKQEKERARATRPKTRRVKKQCK
eukprot:Skav215007  [mRNA]  locus=scaffold508:1276531:1277019:- [translate_table: standard]